MDKEQQAINLLQLGSRMSLHYYKQPLLICNSGGKDSLVLLELAKRAGIPFEVQHSHTTADAPETVRYVRQQMRELELAGVKCCVNMPTYKGERTSMWQLIGDKGLPTRLRRFCCAVLKETSGSHRAVVTGVRADESSQRASRGELETRGKTKADSYKINAENAAELFEDDVRRSSIEHDDKFISACKIRGSTIVNPIIHWTNTDVWEFIRGEHLAYNPCYDMGFNRVGCVGCPMGGASRSREFAIWPKYQEAYMRALQHYLDKHPKQAAKGDLMSWWHWWMEDGIISGQMDLLGGGHGTD